MTKKFLNRNKNPIVNDEDNTNEIQSSIIEDDTQKIEIINHM